MNKGYTDEVWDRWQRLPTKDQKEVFRRLFVAMEEELQWEDYLEEAIYFFKQVGLSIESLSNGRKVI